MTTVLLALSLLIPSLEAQGTGGLPERGGNFRGGARRDPGPPPPRLSDGTPNLGRIELGKGAWLPGQVWRYADVRLDKSQPIPYQPWANALQEYRDKVTESAEDPQGFCIPPGGPRVHTTMFPMEMIQLPEQKRIIQILEGGGHVWREIYMDGRPHPGKDDLDNFPTFLGHSVGHWEGDTLVVDTLGFNEGTWIDAGGNPHTDQMHLVEKYTRPGVNVLHYEATIDDPGAYTKPWTIVLDIPWGANSRVVEYICQENNRYQDNYVKATKGATGTGNSGADSGHGHPAKGTFVGEWGPNANSQDSLVVLMDWDGVAITGTINPGENGVPITKAELNVANWTLHIEGGTGANRVVLDGKFENLTWLARSLAGTYTQGNQKGNFKITRQY
jgi:hypothetical protein